MRDVTSYPKSGVQRSATLYRRSRATVLERSRGRCEARIAGVCTGWAHVTHHIRRRSQGGSDTVDNLLAACDPCHRWIHDNISDSTALGFLKVGQLEPPSTAVLSVTPVASPRSVPG